MLSIFRHDCYMSNGLFNDWVKLSLKYYFLKYGQITISVLEINAYKHHAQKEVNYMLHLYTDAPN